VGWSFRPSGQRWPPTSLWTTVTSLASAIAGPFWAAAPRGRDAAIFQIVSPGIRATPQRPPRNAFAAGFSGVALARRRGRRR